MNNDHIIGLLERAPFGSLSERELGAVRAHIARCMDCQRAYEAARVAELLLKERAAATLEPSPFFQTRVLAALRERQSRVEVSQFQRMWRAANLLVSSMVALVALLAALTYFGAELQPQPQTQMMVISNTFNSDAVEQVIFAPEAWPEEELTYGQVLTTLYEPEEDLPESYLEERNGQRQ